MAIQTIIITDGMHYVRHHRKERFDAIFVDFPYPYNYNLARLYSLEFYRSLTRIIHPQGFVVLDVPMRATKDFRQSRYYGELVRRKNFNQKHHYVNSVLASTVFFAGFTRLFPYHVRNESFLLLTLDDQVPFRTLVDSSLAAQLSDISMADLQNIYEDIFPYRLKRSYINSIFLPRILRNSKRTNLGN